MRARLPLTVISGYLGAGKTTLINRLLAEDHGQRVLVMVNDFGAINIDAALIDSADDDTLTLSNGCVCCTMGGDLFMAVGDVLDRAQRPDHLVIEASGIADPARIANVADAEPELMRAGIVTVVDGTSCEGLLQDARIGPQVGQQIRAADVIALSKDAPEGLAMRLGVQGGAPVIDLQKTAIVAPVILGMGETQAAEAASGHAAYVSWDHTSELRLDRDALEARLADRPAGLFRFKGFVAAPEGGAWEVQCVGPSVRIKRLERAQQTQLVGIGLAQAITRDQIAAWWQG